MMQFVSGDALYNVRILILLLVNRIVLLSNQTRQKKMILDVKYE